MFFAPPLTYIEPLFRPSSEAVLNDILGKDKAVLRHQVEQAIVHADQVVWRGSRGERY